MQPCVLQLHIDGGAKRVIITAPSINAPMLVFGVNHTCYNPNKDRVVSATSCTTNCAAPIVKIMHDNFEVLEAMITSIHAVTASQNTVDGPMEKVKDSMTKTSSCFPEKEFFLFIHKRSLFAQSNYRCVMKTNNIA